MSTEFARGIVRIQGGAAPKVNLLCIGGKPANDSVKLSREARYVNGSPLASMDQVLVLMVNGLVDEGHIYPFGGDEADPKRMGGGIGKGKIIEVEQTADAGSRIFSGPDGILVEEPKGLPKTPGIAPTWLNGIEWPYLISDIIDPVAFKLNIDTEVTFEMAMDERGAPVAKLVIAGEDSCLGAGIEISSGLSGGSSGGLELG